MRNPFKKGDKRFHTFTVTKDDIASFEAGEVHAVCATFTLAREIEWATRLFVLEMKDDEEEGIGTRLDIHHKSPAMVGEKVVIEGEFLEIKKGEILCAYNASVGKRIIAEGITGQKILPKEKLKHIFNNIEKES